MSRPQADAVGTLENLGRDELVRQIRELQGLVKRQEETIARQTAAIASLQQRPRTGAPASAAAVAPEPEAKRRRPVATPVPGFDHTVVFDGGAIGNPGKGYGSYQIVAAAGVVAERRLDYGDRVTNNQAEYRTLIAALEDLRQRLGNAVGRTDVAIRGDSRLVIEQVCGRWKVKNAELQPLHRRVIELTRGFRQVDLAWHARANSARVLGH